MRRARFTQDGIHPVKYSTVANYSLRQDDFAAGGGGGRSGGHECGWARVEAEAAGAISRLVAEAAVAAAHT